MVKVESRSKIRTRTGAARRHRPLCQVARFLFSLCSFNTFPLYYLRAWHRLPTWIHLILVRKSPQAFGRLYLTKTVVGKSASISRYWFCVPDQINNFGCVTKSGRSTLEEMLLLGVDKKTSNNAFNMAVNRIF